METKLIKNTYLSLSFFILSLMVYLMPLILDAVHYRRLLSLTTVFMFYPSLLVSVIFSIKNFNRIVGQGNFYKSRWIILINSLSIVFSIYFFIKMVIVLSTPVE